MSIDGTKRFRSISQYSQHRIIRCLSIIFLLYAIPIYSILADGIVYGSKQYVRKDLALSGGYTSVRIKGPIALSIGLDEDPSYGLNDCSKIRIFTDDNIHAHVSILIDGDVLNIQTTEKVIPSNWIEMTLHCDNVTSVTAVGYSNAIISPIKRDTFAAIADSGYISLSGKLRSLKASATNNAQISLGLLELQNADLTAKNKSYIYLGGMLPELEIPNIDDLKMQATDSGEIHLNLMDTQEYYQEQLAPGIILQSKNVQNPFDSSRRFNGSVYDKVKPKIEQSY